MTIAELHNAVLYDPPFHDARLIKTADWFLPNGRYMAKLVRRIKPSFVLELGTGAGRTAAMIAAALPEASAFTTINWPNPPSGDDVGRELAPWRGDPRIRQVLADTRETAWRIPDNSVDLLYMDSGTTHEFALISVEWELYRPKLMNGAIVVVDDIHFAGSDMERFWDPLPYDKIEGVCGGGAGMFRYVKE